MGELWRAGEFNLQTSRLSWILWSIGIALVVCSWIGIVSGFVGWIGSGLTIVGCLMSVVGRSQKRVYSAPIPVQRTSPAEEVAKLELLRKEGVISDEEFMREKARLLAHNY